MTTPSIAGNGYLKQFRLPGLKNIIEPLLLWCLGRMVSLITFCRQKAVFSVHPWCAVGGRL